MTHPVAPVSTSPTRSIALHRIIVALYAILSLAGLGRSSFQVLTKFDQAPLAYSLSSFAALMYVLATLAIALSARKGPRGVAMVALGIELVRVVGVGAASLVRPDSTAEQRLQRAVASAHQGVLRSPRPTRG